MHLIGLSWHIFIKACWVSINLGIAEQLIIAQPQDRKQSSRIGDKHGMVSHLKRKVMKNTTRAVSPTIDVPSKENRF